MRVYFDSCILIYRVERREPWSQRIALALASPERGELELATSELTRMECRVRPLALARTDVLQDYDRFFAQAPLFWQAMNREVFELATRLRATHRLKAPDALHLAAALASECDELWTNDRRLDAAAGSALSVVVPD